MKHKNIKILTWFNFFTDFRLYAPIAIIYFAHVTHSYALGAAIFSISAIASSFFEIPTGIFSDKIGRRKTVIWGAVSAVIYAVFYAIGINFWFLAIGAIFDGLSQSFYSGNNDALLHDTLSENDEEHLFGEHYGKITSMFQIALGVSAILGSIIASWSFALIMWLSVIPQIICLYLSFQLIQPTLVTSTSGNMYAHLKEAYLYFIRNKKLRLLSITSIIGYGFGEAGYQFQAAFYAMLWPVWAIGIAKTLSNIGAVIGYRIGGRVAKKFDNLKVLLADNLYGRLINTIATAFPTILSPVLMSTTSIFYGAANVSRSALFQKEFREEQRATMGSLNSLAGNIFYGVIAFVLGLIADKVSPAKALLTLSLVQFVNLFFYWKLFKHDESNTQH